MNKIFFFSILSLLLFSCSKKKENSSRASKGKINSVSVVIDDQLWNGVIGDSIRNKLASPVEGLSKEEPQFDINQYPIHVMEGFVTKGRTIIIVKKGNSNNFKIKKNQYATPQNVIHITGKTLADLVQIIENKTPEIITLIQNAEIKAHQLIVKDSLLDTKLIENQFNVDLKISKKYSYALKNQSFVWLINEFPSGISNLIITELPLSTIKKGDDVLEKMIRVHDSIGALYIKCKESNSSQYIDRSYPLYFTKLLIDGKVAYEVKGLWRMRNNYMFGSSINYFIIDSKNNRILFLEGFCYIPSGLKRNCRHELESVIKGMNTN